MIRLRCPKCQKLLRVNDALAGSMVSCPSCQGKFRVPARSGEEISQGPPRKSYRPDEDDPDEPPRRRRRAEEPEDADEEISQGPPRKSYRPDEDDPDEPPRRRRRAEEPEDWEDQENERRPRKRKKKRRGRGSLFGGYDATLVVGLSLAGVWVILFGLSFVSLGFAYMLDGVGILVSLVGGIWFLVVAFQDSAGSGVLCLLCGPYQLYYLATHFEEEKWPFFTELIGWGMVLSAIPAGGINIFGR